MKIFCILAGLLAVQSLASLGDGLRFLRYVRRSLRQPPGNYSPRAALIIPCKAIDREFELNISRFLTQDYPNYEVIFVVASEKDPAYRTLAARLKNTSAPGAFAGPKTRLLVAGYSEVRGEKVNNLLCGLLAVDRKAEALVFADADARPAQDWLRSLIAPLADPRVTVSTGFRWYLPGASFVSQLRAAWDTSIATMLGDHGHNFAWGGSTAIRAADFRRLEVAERYWAKTVSDDYGVTRAARHSGGKIRFEPRCLVPSREESTFREFLRWANRQIIITRVYAPHLWWMGLVTFALYGGTFLCGLVLIFLPSSSMPERIAIAVTLLAILLLGIAKARIRTIVALELFPEESAALNRFGARYWQLAPLIPWMMFANFVVAGLTRRIEWCGTRYELKSNDEVRVLWRKDA